jgi:hypothetical protein
MFLHEQGYNYYTMPGLTIAEINVMVQEHNKEQARQQRAQAKQQAKARRR